VAPARPPLLTSLWTATVAAAFPRNVLEAAALQRLIFAGSSGLEALRRSPPCGPTPPASPALEAARRELSPTE